MNGEQAVEERDGALKKPHGVLAAGKLAVHLFERDDRLSCRRYARRGTQFPVLNVKALIQDFRTVPGEMGVINSRVFKIRQWRTRGDYGETQMWKNVRRCTIGDRTSLANHSI